MRSFMWNQRYKYQQTEQDDWFEDFDDDAESSKLTSSHGGYQPLDSPGSKNSQSGNVRRIQAAACLGVLIVIVVMILALALPVNQNTKDAFAHSSLRLPRDVLPETYKLFLVPDIKSGYYEGSVDIGVKVVKSTPSVFLHVKGLTLTRTPVILGSRDETIPIRETSLNGTLEMLYIGVEETLLKGMTYNIHIEFHRNLANDFVGFYSTKYKHANGEDSTIATTYLEPTFARQVFPCFDEPDMKAEFTISIVRDKDHISMSNMPLDGESAKYGDTGMMLDTFKTTVKMSTYLVALTVCDFQYVEGYSASRIQVKVYTTPDKINMADHALSTATECLSFYESFFKVPYPLPKMDMIAIPQYNDAGMESWGLISYQESSILYDSQNTPVTVLQDVTAAIAHEIAHQWFGNLVTMKWWNDLWLNEGFATYVEYIGTDHINPEWRMMEQFVYGVTQQAMTLDALHHSHPVSLPVNNPADIKKLFDKISYLKGAAIIRMAMDFLGYDAFRNGLQDYLSAYAYSNAKNDNLWSAFTKSGENGEDKVIVKDVMDTWTLQMGYPVVTLSRNDDTITATQERFLIYPDGELSSNNASPFDYTWKIPLTLVTSSDPDNISRMWLNTKKDFLDIEQGSTWYKGNVNMSGFYRVNYDDAGWNAIIEQMKSNHNTLMSSDRASIIDDIFTLARAGYVGHERALNLSLYLDREMEYVPIMTAIAKFRYIGEMLTGSGNNHVLFNKFVLQRLNGSLESLGMTDSGSHTNKLLRKAILEICVIYGHENVVKKMTELFYKYMTLDEKVDPNMRHAVYCAGVRYGDEYEWEMLWDKYRRASTYTKRNIIIRSMACSADSVVLERYLDYVMDSSLVRLEDRADIITSVAENVEVGRSLAWNFLKKNWHELSAFFSDEMDTIITSLSRTITSQEQLQTMSDFLTSHSDVNSRKMLSRVTEHGKMNIDWLQKYSTKVNDWLNEKVDLNKPPGIIET